MYVAEFINGQPIRDKCRQGMSYIGYGWYGELKLETRADLFLVSGHLGTMTVFVMVSQ